MAAQRLDFTGDTAAEQGSTFRQQLTLVSGDPPVAQDLTGCSALMMIRTAYNSPTPVATLSSTPTATASIVLGGTAGTIDLFLAASATQSIYVPLAQTAAAVGSETPPENTYVYDLYVTYPSGDSERICYGDFVITASVTHS
jgi:hypothetical protein